MEEPNSVTIAKVLQPPRQMMFERSYNFVYKLSWQEVLNDTWVVQGVYSTKQLSASSDPLIDLETHTHFKYCVAVSSKIPRSLVSHNFEDDLSHGLPRD